MRKLTLSDGFEIPAIAVGCMRLTALDEKQAERLIRTATDAGANFFDHADIYGGGECESLFSRAVGMTPSLRETMILQTKCGITQGRYDFSKAHILEAVDGSLRRLKTDYIDILLLHRPDALMEPEEVAAAFSELHRAGKVRRFGVSNHTPYQIELLKRCVDAPLLIDQIQISLAHCPTIAQGMNMNNFNDNAVDRDNGLLDYCRLTGVCVQAWSPFQAGMFGGCFIDDPKYAALNDALQTVADRYETSKEAIVIAWLARHPAGIQPVTGTMNETRLADCIHGAQLRLTREEWYDLYKAAGNPIV